MNSKVIFAFFVVLLAFGFFFLISGRKSSETTASELDAFAQCLNEGGVVMYGADWCPHCQNEKKAFGKSFQYVNYVECPKDPSRCLSEGVQAYPTWKFADGRALVGEQGVEKLSEESGCKINQ